MDSPSDIKGLDRLQALEEFHLFDVFIYTYYPTGTDKSSNKYTTQLWVWQPLGSSVSSIVFGWKPVGVGYICPGPGVLKGRHLVITDHGKPAWLSGATVYRRYYKALESGGDRDDESVIIKGKGTFSETQIWLTGTSKTDCRC